MKNRILLLLLALLGLSSCNNDPDNKDPDVTPVMYGTPTAYFTVKGRVTDTAGAPIRGILITPVEAWRCYAPDPDFIPDRKVETAPLFSEPIYTSETGEYELRNTCFDWNEFFVTVLVEDVDGPRNGGSFPWKWTDIEITRENRTQDDGGVSRYEKQAPDIVLTPDK